MPFGTPRLPGDERIIRRWRAKPKTFILKISIWLKSFLKTKKDLGSSGRKSEHEHRALCEGHANSLLLLLSAIDGKLQSSGDLSYDQLDQQLQGEVNVFFENFYKETEAFLLNPPKKKVFLFGEQKISFVEDIAILNACLRAYFRQEFTLSFEGQSSLTIHSSQLDSLRGLNGFRPAHDLRDIIAFAVLSSPERLSRNKNLLIGPAIRIFDWYQAPVISQEDALNIYNILCPILELLFPNPSVATGSLPGQPAAVAAESGSVFSVSSGEQLKQLIDVAVDLSWSRGLSLLTVALQSLYNGYFCSLRSILDIQFCQSRESPYVPGETPYALSMPFDENYDSRKHYIGDTISELDGLYNVSCSYILGRYKEIPLQERIRAFYIFTYYQQQARFQGVLSPLYDYKTIKKGSSLDIVVDRLQFTLSEIRDETSSVDNPGAYLQTIFGDRDERVRQARLFSVFFEMRHIAKLIDENSFADAIRAFRELFSVPFKAEALKACCGLDPHYTQNDLCYVFDVDHPVPRSEFKEAFFNSEREEPGFVSILLEKIEAGSAIFDDSLKEQYAQLKRDITSFCSENCFTRDLSSAQQESLLGDGSSMPLQSLSKASGALISDAQKIGHIECGFFKGSAPADVDSDEDDTHRQAAAVLSHSKKC